MEITENSLFFVSKSSKPIDITVMSIADLKEWARTYYDYDVKKQTSKEILEKLSDNGDIAVLSKPGEVEKRIINNFSDSFLEKCKHELEVRRLERQLADVLNFDNKTLREIAESRISDIEINADVMHWDDYDEESLIEIAEEFIDSQDNPEDYRQKAMDNFIKESKESKDYSSPEHDPVESSKGVVGKTDPGVSGPKR